MAQQFNSPDFGTLTVPSAVALYKVQASNAGLAANGIVMLVGEADAGPDYTLEKNLNANAFGPQQLGAVISKYQSGPLVDAVRAFVAPANDPNITGSPTAFIIVKTNPSSQAVGPLTDFTSATYGNIGARLLGAGGNNISYSVVAATIEVVPTTGPFTMLVPIATFAYSIRVNGGTAQTGGTVAGGTLPPAFVSSLSGVTGITATGGTNRNILVSGNDGNNISIAIVSGQAISLTLSLGSGSLSVYNAIAQIGDTVYISASSALATASGNSTLAGSYVVTALGTGTVLQVTKLMDASGTPGTNTTISVGTATVAVVAVTDLDDFAPVTIAITAAVPVDGLGKSLEINALTSSSDLLTNCAYALGTSKVTWVSTAASPKVLASATEYSATLNVNNVVSNLQESLTSGGEVALQIEYTGTTAQAVIGPVTVGGPLGLILTWTGGSNPAGTLTMLFSNFPSVAAVAAYINAQTGFKAQPGNGLLGLLPSTALDQGTFHICSTFGALVGRIKVDAFRFQTRGIGQSVQVGLIGTLPVAGVPQPQVVQFLAGGARGGSSNANITGGIDALLNVKGNFLVPLFSQNATLDIAGGTTDPSSTYDIASINAYAKTHVLLASQPKRKKARQACLSIRDTFANDQAAASNIASFRCTMCFQDVQNSGATGTLQFFQPWMAAGLAASIQAAGFYKGIVQKYANCSGIVQAAGDYNDQNDDQETVALLAGLLPMKRDLDAGGVYFLSDQTTYGSDNNFVYNSLQAVYVADTMALTLAQRMQRAFVGQSVADISASQAVGYVKNILADFLTLKLIAPSDGAPKGYQPGSIVVSISGTTMTVNLTVYLAGLLYFVPIVFQINQVQQTATA